jgi:hypothetical protein
VLTLTRTLAFFLLISIPTLFNFSESYVYSSHSLAAGLHQYAHRLDESERWPAGPHVDPDDDATLWEEPRDIESRDLFFGPGGSQGAPNASGGFTFVKRKGSPTDTSEKIVIRDSAGHTWTAKFGPEARAEVAASRILWAVGYHVDQDYFVQRAHIEGRGGFDIMNVRLERDDDGLKETGRWAWNANPFAGTRELQGLKVLMALLNNWDLSTANNRIAQGKSDGKIYYYVSDVGASLGTTGSWINKLPMYRDVAVPRSRGDARAFAAHKFIKGVSKGEIVFYWKRQFGRDVLGGVSVESARWMGNLLANLSDKQLSDAFRAGGFNDDEVTTFVAAIRNRIQQLQNVGQTVH